MSFGDSSLAPTQAQTQPSAQPHTRAFAAPPSANVMWEHLVSQQAATDKLMTHHEQLVELIKKLQTPAQMETIVLTPQNPVSESRERVEDPVLSIGLLNPNNIPIYFSGIGSAAPNMRSPSAPPNSLIVLPIAAQMIEVAASASDLGQNNALCFLLRFFTVQPAFLGKGV